MSGANFFERQALARRNTLLLIGLFTLAVLIITLAINLIGFVFTRNAHPGTHFGQWLLTQQGIITSVTVVSVILLGSLVRWVDLAAGGERVARMVGARQLDPSTRDEHERRLVNIVEEMAIASGIPVPQLYVMDQEAAINAFVAGYSPTEAVMVVTRGALTELTRDELQGVVGHEFSHILNGDMRINVRIIAILAGILMIGQIGQFLVQTGAYASAGRRRSRDDNKLQGAALLAGLALMVVGYAGVFFGRLIQAAVSRQREMLADASSVQFTRNPEGIGGALFKIGDKTGLLTRTSHASDMNHMCFAESVKVGFASLLASHPPIEARINAIQPGLLARLKSRQRHHAPAPSPVASKESQTLGQLATATLAPLRPGSSQTALKLAPQQRLSESAGQISRANEDYAAALIRQMPATFRDLLYTRTGAIQLCYALLTHELDANARAKALALLDDHHLFRPQADLLDRLYPALNSIGPALRFPALELAMPSLRRLDEEEKSQLLQQVDLLAKADGRISLFEFALTSFLGRHLAPGAGRVTPVKYRRYKEVLPDLALLMSLVARAASRDHNEAEALFTRVMGPFLERDDNTIHLQERVSGNDLRTALHKLSQLSPLLKPAVIDACGECILHDGKVDTREYEILRLVADQLDCPMPPLPVAIAA